MTAAFPVQKFAAVWDAAEHQLGLFQSVESIQIQPEKGMQAALAVCRFERRRAAVEVVFDDQRRVSGLFFKPIAVPWQAPPYVKPEAFEERSVSVGSAPALPGTLTLPKAE